MLGFFPQVGAVVAALPLPVLGGAGLALFGSVAASGIRACGRCITRATRTWSSSPCRSAWASSRSPSRLLREFPAWFQTIFDSGISAAAVTAVLLNILFNVLGRRDEPTREAALVAESPTVGVTPDYDVPGGPADARDTADDSGIRRSGGPSVTPGRSRSAAPEH